MCHESSFACSLCWEESPSTYRQRSAFLDSRARPPLSASLTSHSIWETTLCLALRQVGAKEETAEKGNLAFVFKELTV